MLNESSPLGERVGIRLYFANIFPVSNSRQRLSIGLITYAKLNPELRE
jgi:hypothetical protein